jgi:hypothetical protein
MRSLAKPQLPVAAPCRKEIENSLNPVAHN